MRSLLTLLTLLVAAALAACGGSGPGPGSSGQAQPARPSCTASYEVEDALSPSYRAGAPVRAVVGSGHVLTGVVRSRRDCVPVAGARVELWPELAGKGHPDGQRATVLTAADGSYRFQSDPPTHIHMRVTAAGFRPMASNHYHPEGRGTGRFDVLLDHTAG